MHSRFVRYVATILIVLLLQACGGGGGGGGSAGSSGPATVTGVAATGAAIAGTVTLKDVTGAPAQRRFRCHPAVSAWMLPV